MRRAPEEPVEQPRRRMRVRAARFGIAAALGAVALIATASPAWAHHPLLSGSTWCTPDGRHVVTWTIGNSEGGAGMAMVITSAGATNGGTPYAVQGYVSPVPPGAQT